MVDSDAILSALARTVRALRAEQGWSRKELANRAGLSERFLADIEGGSGNPSLLRLCQLAEALQTSPRSLLGSTDDDSFVAGKPRHRLIALLGLRGAGKSTVGKLLSERLACPFYELDAEIERAAGLSLAEMFALHGEAYYRRSERSALRELLETASFPTVLATGGGLVTDLETYAMLRHDAHTVWLRADPRDHWERVVAQGDTRPMAAAGERAFSDLRTILEERDPLYRQAEVIVPTSGRRVEEIAKELATRFQRIAE